MAAKKARKQKHGATQAAGSLRSYAAVAFSCRCMILCLLLACMLPMLLPSAAAFDHEVSVDETSLPYKGTKGFNMVASSNSTINISYGRFLSGPAHMEMLGGVAKYLEANISVPQGTVPGNYTSEINMSNGNFFAISIEVLPEDISFGIFANKQHYWINETAFITLEAPLGTELNLTITSAAGTKAFSTKTDKDTVMAYVLAEAGDHVIAASFSYKNHTQAITKTVSATKLLACSFAIGPVFDIGTKKRLEGAIVSGGKAPYTYRWSVDGTPVAGDKPTYTFNKTGNSHITLNVIDSNSQSVTCENSVEIIDSRYMLTVIVLDNESRRPLGDTEVILDDGLSIKSNANGKAIFANVEKGLHEISTKKLLYKASTAAINVSATTSVTISISALKPQDRKVPKIGIISPGDGYILGSRSTDVKFDLESDHPISYCWLLAKRDGTSGYKVAGTMPNATAGRSVKTMQMTLDYNGVYDWLIECSNAEGTARTPQYVMTVSGIDEPSIDYDSQAAADAGQQAGTRDQDLAAGRQALLKADRAAEEGSAAAARDQVSAKEDAVDTSAYDRLLSKIADAKPDLAKATGKTAEISKLLGIASELERYEKEAGSLRQNAIDISFLSVSAQSKKTEQNKIEQKLKEITSKTPVDIKISLSGTIQHDLAQRTQPATLSDAADEYILSKGLEMSESKKKRYVKELAKLQENAGIKTDYYIVDVKYADGATGHFSVIRKTVSPKKDTAGLFLYEDIPKQMAQSIASIDFRDEYLAIKTDPIVGFDITSATSADRKTGNDEIHEESTFTYIIKGRAKTEDIEQIRSLIFSGLSGSSSPITGFVTSAAGFAAGGGVVSFAVLILVLGSTGYVMVYRNPQLRQRIMGRTRKMASDIGAGMGAVQPRMKKDRLMRLIDMSLDLIRLDEMQAALANYPKILDLYTEMEPIVQQKLYPIIEYFMHEMNFFQMDRMIQKTYLESRAGNQIKALECYDKAEELYYHLPDNFRQKIDTRISNLRFSMEMKTNSASKGLLGQQYQNVDDELYAGKP